MTRPGRSPLTLMQLGLAAGLALAVAAAGCASSAEPASDWVEQAGEAHRAADEAMGRGDTDAAREALRRAVEAPAPESVAAGDARAVRQDLFARLAEVELAAERPAEAQRWANRGLELGNGGDVFRANLLIARGRAREALGNDLEAATDYHEALQINDDLLQQVLDGERMPQR